MYVSILHVSIFFESIDTEICGVSFKLEGAFLPYSVFVIIRYIILRQ